MKEKRDVLFLCQYFYPEYVSSATLPYDTALALSESGANVSVMCGYPKEYNKKGKVSKEEQHRNIDIKRLKYLQLKRESFLGRIINYLSFTIATLFHFLHFKKFSAIIVYSNPPILPLLASLSSIIFGTKVVFVCYDVYPEIAYLTNSIRKGGWIDKLMKFINRNTYKYANTIVALSSEMKEFLINNRSYINQENVTVIPNWYEDVPMDHYKTKKMNEKFEVLDANTNFIVSYFGNMGVCQDIDTVLNAIRQLRDDNSIKFLFAGHGNKMTLLKDIVAKENLTNVLLLDFLHDDDYQEALMLSDCFMVSLIDGLRGLAVPSRTYSYMAAGKPVIAIMESETDIVRDLVKNQAGYSIDVGDVEKLVSAIQKLKGDPKLKTQMGNNIYLLFKRKYTTEKCTQQYVEMMKLILEVS